jgi:FtsZ-interacting cell division protein YlmF
MFLLGLTINLSYPQTKEIVIDPEEVVGKYVTGDPEEYLDIKKDGIFYLKEKGKYYSIVGAPETTGKWEIEKDKIIFIHPLGIVTRGKIEPNVIIDEEGKIWFKEGSISQTKEIVIDPEEVVGKYVTDDPKEYLDIKKDGTFYSKEKDEYYYEMSGKWEIGKDEIILTEYIGLRERWKIEPNVLIDEEGKIWFKEGSIPQPQEAPALIPSDTQRIKESVVHRIQRLEPLLSEGPPVRERDWVTRQLDRLTGAEWVIDNAIWLFELAQEQWQEARDFLAEADLENAQRRVIYAEATLLNAYTTLSAAYGVIDEGLSRAERVVWYYRKGAHESEKLVALLGFGPKGYEVASRLCLLDDFVVEGLTQGWEGSSKTLAFRLVLDKLIDASGILKDSAVSDKVVYDNLRTALSDGEFMRTLITEFAAHELVTEGIEKVVQSTLSWLEKHRGSFVDIDLGSGLADEYRTEDISVEEKEEAPVREVPVESPSKITVEKIKEDTEPAETEIKKEATPEVNAPLTEPSVVNTPKVEPEAEVIKESEISSEKKVYTVQVGAFSTEKNAQNLAKEIRDKGYQTYVVKGKTLYKVQVGEFKNYQEAQNIAQKLKELGYHFFITTR